MAWWALVTQWIACLALVTQWCAWWIVVIHWIALWGIVTKGIACLAIKSPSESSSVIGVNQCIYLKQGVRQWMARWARSRLLDRLEG